MKKTLAFLFAIALIFSANVSFANEAGCDGDCPTAEEDTITEASDYCMDFYTTFDAYLEVNTDGTGHTLGAWCMDWAPTGNVIVHTLSNYLELVVFNMSGTVVSSECKDTIYIGGYILALVNVYPVTVSLGGYVVWYYDDPISGPVGPFNYQGQALCY